MVSNATEPIAGLPWEKTRPNKGRERLHVGTLEQGIQDTQFLRRREAERDRRLRCGEVEWCESGLLASPQVKEEPMPPEKECREEDGRPNAAAKGNVFWARNLLLASSRMRLAPKDRRLTG